MAIIGTASSELLLGTSANETIDGAAGNDTIEGGDGADTIIGGLGQDSLYGGDGADVFRFGGDLLTDWNLHADTIYDFATGTGGDRLDFSGLLEATGYVGSDPIGDGYLRIKSLSSGIKIQFDPDGFGGNSPKTLVVLKGVAIEDFSIVDNLIVTPIIDVPGDGGGTPPEEDEDATPPIIGTASSELLLGTSASETIDGAAGNDTIEGGDGADTIIGGLGQDSLYGGDGADVFRFGGDLLTDWSLHADTIYDFATGTGGDRLDFSGLLEATGYVGSDPIGDGYLRIKSLSSGIKIQFDPDGFGGNSPKTLVILKGVAIEDFSIVDNLIVTPIIDVPGDGGGTPPDQKILYVTTLGQSNAEGLRVMAGDNDSGIIRLENGLEAATDFDDVVTLLKDEDGDYIDIAVGGSFVNGDSTNQTSKMWWHTDNDTAGQALDRAVGIMSDQISDLATSSEVTPIAIWGQGESDAFDIGAAIDKDAQADIYKNATLEVFKYIRDTLGEDVNFYIMQTGRYNVDAAVNRGISDERIENVLSGLEYIRAAQEELALEYDFIHFAAVYDDLMMSYEGDPVAFPTDVWHLDYDEREVVGDRLAEFIALELGYNNVLQNPGNYPHNLLTDITIRESSGDSIVGSSQYDIIVGTTGDDTINGGDGDDVIYAAGGSDTIIGGIGNDTSFYNGNSVDYAITSFATYSTIENTISGDIDDLFDVEIIEFADVTYIWNGTIWNEDTANNAPVANNVLANQNLVEGESLLFYISDVAFYDADGDSLTYTATLADDSALPSWLIFDDIANNFSGTSSGYDIGTITVKVTASDGLESVSDTFDITVTAYSNYNVMDGTASNDTIKGTSGDDSISGFAGNDSLKGGNGDDIINGGAGNDSLKGGAGADTIDGGAGNDRLYYTASDSGVNIDLASGIATGGIAEGDVISNVEYIIASEFDDIINGSISGDDTIKSGAGDDLITGGAGDNFIDGKAGADTIDGGAGKDRLYLGSDGDADIVIFSDLADSTDSATDTVYQFDQADGDLIDVSGLGFTSIGDFAVTSTGGNTYIDDNSSAFKISLSGTYSLTDSDFIF